MEITVAKHSGFCIGVSTAVETALSCKGENVYILGELIHNPAVNTHLKNAGLKTVDSIEQIDKGTVIIRSHGAGKEVYKNIEQKNLRLVDATCVFVKNIHKKAEKFYLQGYQIVIVGDENHPEVQGINGWCGGTAIICNDENKLIDLKGCDKVCVLAQTTIPPEKFDKIVKNIANHNIKTVEVFNTICYTTIERQKEAALLSQQNDCVIVIGGKTSSNTKKLECVCKEYNDNVISIEYPEELDIDYIKKYKKVAVVAGASTPKELIKEVYLRMEQKVNANNIVDSAEEENKVVIDTATAEKEVADSTEAANAEIIAEQTAQTEKAEEKAESKPVTEEPISVMDQALKDMDLTERFKRGQTVKATVALVADEGLSLAVGTRKSDVLMNKDNIEIDGSYDKSAFNVGDVIDVVVTGTSPLELSRKQYLINKKDDVLVEELKDGKEFKISVSGFNKGGLTARFGSFTVFVPASLIRMGFVKPEEFEKYNGKELRVKLVEIKGKTIIASAKDIIMEERKRREEARDAAISAFFDSIEVGQVIEGRVVRFTDFGAFVNVNGFDCLAHISDLAWTNVKKAEDILEKDKTYEFAILKIDREKQHVSIGYKQLQPKPWDLAEEKYPQGSIVKGKVVRIAPFGAFVEVESGIDGLVHVSQITHDWIENPASALKVGDEIEAKVIEVKPEAQKLTLSIKALQPEPEIIRPDKKANEDGAENKDNKKYNTDRKPRQRKERNEGEIREWKEGAGGTSIGDLLKDFSIDIAPEKKTEEENTKTNE